MPTSLLNVAAKSATEPDSTARKIVDRAPAMETNVGDAERALSIALGTGLTACSLAARKPGFLSLLGTIAGGSLILRGVTGHCMGYHLLGKNTAGGEGPQSVMGAGEGVKVEQAITIDKPAAVVYQYWRRYANLARFMPHLTEVKDLGNGRSHWAAKGPLGVTVEWDAETITDTPNEAISWKSVEGADVDTAGSVHFREAAGGRGTEVRVSLKYVPPGGKLGAAAAKLLGEDPGTQIREDLMRLKTILEGGA